jgi:hypothetical protein
MSHRVRKHYWKAGVLTTIEHIFDSLEEAIKSADDGTAHSSKVYSESGELLHASSVNATATYA